VSSGCNSLASPPFLGGGEFGKRGRRRLGVGSHDTIFAPLSQKAFFNPRFCWSSKVLFLSCFNTLSLKAGSEISLLPLLFFPLQVALQWDLTGGTWLDIKLQAAYFPESIRQARQGWLQGRVARFLETGESPPVGVTTPAGGTSVAST
jgi:hypothetical protein